MKKLSLFLILLLAAPALRAQDVFAPYFGEWVGALQYLDYSSGDTVAISARLTVKPVAGKPWQAQLVFDYPLEKGHGHTDTVSYEGPQRLPGGTTLEWRVAEAGMDDRRPALLLHSYSLRPEQLCIWKEVQLNSRPGFFLRNRYVFLRARR